MKFYPFKFELILLLLFVYNIHACQRWARATCVSLPLTLNRLFTLNHHHVYIAIQLSSHFVQSRSVNSNTNKMYSMPQSHADIDNDDDIDDTSNGNRLTISFRANKWQRCHRRENWFAIYVQYIEHCVFEATREENLTQKEQTNAQKKSTKFKKSLPCFNWYPLLRHHQFVAAGTPGACCVLVTEVDWLNTKCTHTHTNNTQRHTMHIKWTKYQIECEKKRWTIARKRSQRDRHQNTNNDDRK